MSLALRPLNVAVAQFPIALDAMANLREMTRLLGALPKETEAVVFPEGALSGYAEMRGVTEQLDFEAIEVGRRALASIAARESRHIFYGCCVREGRDWFNATIYAGPCDANGIYRKINLATLERGAFVAGSELSVLSLQTDIQSVGVGIQMCREIRFPEQWQHLARHGAEVFVYPTFATGDSSEFQVWRSHLISRAAENQRFVFAANTASPTQKCPSMIVSPKGGVLAELGVGETGVATAHVDVSDVSDWFLQQARRDVVRVDVARECVA